MSDVTIPGVGRVTFPASMALADIQAASQRLASQVGSDRKGGYNADLANIDQMMTGTAPGVPASQLPTHITLPVTGSDIHLAGPAKNAFDATTGFVDRQVTPAVLGATIGSIAAPPMAAAGAAPFLARLLSAVPQVAGAGIGGGAGSALESSQNPSNTPEMITRKAILDGLQQAGAQVAGIGAGEIANKVMSPDLASVRKLSEWAQEKAAFVPGKVSEYIAGLPEDSVVRSMAQSNFVTNAASGAHHLMDAADKLGVVSDLAQGHLAAAAFGGPVGWTMLAAKQLLDPGPIMRYLTKEPASPLTQEAMRQLLTGAIRTNAGTDQPLPEGAKKAQDDPFDALKPPRLAQNSP